MTDNEDTPIDLEAVRRGDALLDEAERLKAEGHTLRAMTPDTLESLMATLGDLLDNLDPDHRTDARRRIAGARRELAETIEALEETRRELPDDLEAMTPDDLRAMIDAMRLASNCLEADANRAAVALDDLEATDHE